MTDRDILRALAYEFLPIMKDDINAKLVKLHTQVNDLKQPRPVVLVDELPWHEMDIDGELTLRCEDAFLRELEWHMRTTIYRHKHFRADRIVNPFLPIHKVMRREGDFKIHERVVKTDQRNNIIAHEYHDTLKTQQDIDAISPCTILYDEHETRRRFNLAGEILGDILPVKIMGVTYFAATYWDDISRMRGVENLMMDLIDKPDFMHAIVRKLADNKLRELEQLEAIGAFEREYETLHCTAMHVSDLPSEDFDGVHLTRKDIWGRGAAQIFGSVSKEMHDEFDITYMAQTIGQCGLVYYGCCEPLDKKIDIVEKIPNLRKIGATPWADIDAMCEVVGSRYVIAAKPNPASVAVANLDKHELRKELGRIIKAVRRNNCSCDIVLKDISTCCNNPQNIFDWTQIAMQTVQE